MKHCFYYTIFLSFFFHHVDSLLQIPKYCREKERLIGSEELDEYLLVEAVINSTVILECRFCGANDPNPEPKIWYRQNLFQNISEQEVDIEMNSNVSLNRVYVTPELSLVIKEFHFNDSGIYRCHGEGDQEVENKYNYKVEPVFENTNQLNIQRGDITEWEKYRETNLMPVTLRFSVSKMREFVKLRKNGIALEVLSELGIWSPCESCNKFYGIRTCETLCRIKRHINETYKGNVSVVNFFQNFPLIPCRSYVLAANFPGVSKAVKHLPSFILEEKCKKCKKIKKIKKFAFKYKKKYLLSEGSHLVISCPEATSENTVVWRKNGLIMKKGTVIRYKKKDKRSKTVVDVFSTLYLMEVSDNEEGNYTCYVNDEKMMMMKVVVVSKSKLLTKAFIRHSKYLSFILLLTSLCYCAGIIQGYKQKDELDRDSYTKLENVQSDEEELDEAQWLEI